MAEPKTPTRVHATEVSIGYGRGDVVHGASIDLAPGTVTALVGPNGSGKSTLLRGLCRLQSLSGGSVHLDGEREIRTFSAREFATRVTMLAQNRPTLAGVTVKDAVEYGRHPHRSRWRGHDPDGEAAVSHALELAGITDLKDETLDALSGGQIQRAWFASALAQDTAVLLLDEPTNHLDLRYQVEVLELIGSLADEHGVTVGVVLHDLNQAAAVSDRVVVMDRGEVRADGPPNQAMTSELLSQVYDLEVSVRVDADSGSLEVTVPRSHRRSRLRSPALPA